jgi:cell division topological specificity factor
VSLPGGKKITSASIARDRLRIILETERGERDGPEFLSTLSSELRDLIGRHVQVDAEDVQITIDQVNGQEVLELCVRLPGAEQEAQRVTGEAQPAQGATEHDGRPGDSA